MGGTGVIVIGLSELYGYSLNCWWPERSHSRPVDIYLWFNGSNEAGKQ